MKAHRRLIAIPDVPPSRTEKGMTVVTLLIVLGALILAWWWDAQIQEWYER